MTMPCVLTQREVSSAAVMLDTVEMELYVLVSKNVFNKHTDVSVPDPKFIPSQISMSVQ